MKSSRLFWPTLMSLLLLGLAVGLGIWQLQRLAWKDALIEKITARTKAPPVTADQGEAIWRKTGDIEYLRVRAAGRFAHDLERYYYAPSGSGPGWHIYTPLMTRGGRLLMVNRGFVPDENPPAAAPIYSGQITVTGWLLPSQGTSSLGPQNAEEGILTTVARIDTSRLAVQFAEGLAPGYIDLISESPPAGGVPTVLPEPFQAQASPHLLYAIQWFAFAAIASIGWVIYLRKQFPARSR